MVYGYFLFEPVKHTSLFRSLS